MTFTLSEVVVIVIACLLLRPGYLAARAILQGLAEGVPEGVRRAQARNHERLESGRLRRSPLPCPLCGDTGPSAFAIAQGARATPCPSCGGAKGPLRTWAGNLGGGDDYQPPPEPPPPGRR